MSFGGGGFGGFGQNNNQQQQAQPSAFGGFGQNNTTASTGFGAANTGGGFGGNAGGGVFGGSNNNTGGGFGSGGGFGANNNAGGAFGAKPAFGAPATTTGSSMFGGTTANNSTTTGFGGFGGSTNTNAASPSTFGTTNNTSGGVFGAAKPTGFGASTTGNSLFGGGANTTNTTGGFGASAGFGGNNTLGGGGGDPPGTGVTPFQAFTEKEGTSTTSNVFQNICFQDPYKKFSAEELRLVDYAQGRKHGNASGTGAFGVSSGFGGGFGATANNNQTAGGFGANTASNTTGGGLFGGGNNNATTGGAFGSGGTTGFGTTNTTAGGGLFGNANKPATGGGLFGSAGAQPQQTNSVFGGGGNTGGAFGAANNNNNNTGGTFGQAATNTGGGLFGNANQAKPAGTGFGAFGQAANTNTTGSAFGGSNTTGGAFGAANTTTNTSSGLFGGNNNTNTQQAAGGMFGNANNTNTQQNNTNSPFGGFGGQQNQTQQAGGGLFANQNKPATGGLFGGAAPAATNNNASGGLFGNANNNQQQQTGSTFGQSNSGSLFGGAKPASGGGLFGNSTNAQPNTSGGLFGGSGLGQNNTQQNTSGGLFGAANNNQQKPGGLFGNPSQPSGGGVFGGQNNQNQGSSLFGGASNNQQNQQGSTFGSSLLGNSQQNSNTPQGLTANLNDVSAYGTPALFASLGGNEAPNPGPLATPLSGNAKPRKSSILPMYKLAPASASRFATPQKRGFGFSYSSYGTPGGSPASISSTPSGLGRSLLGSSSSGNLSKSMSTNNLRRTFNSEDSILAPGAFSSSSNTRWYGSTGSKKLVINREIRSDLFTTPQKDKPAAEGNGTNRKLLKRVSFDTSNVDSEETTTPVRALPAPEDSPSTQAEDTPRQPKPAANGAKSPEMEKVFSGNELAIVQEDSNAAAAAVDAHASSGFENVPGSYWMQPSKDELQGMNRIQRQKVDGFTVGRDNVGEIKFKVPVDLSGIDLDEICGGIIQLEPRSATVYPITAKKPPMGKGLNVPARITLEQSWPRAGGREKRISSDPKRFIKHIERLQRIPDTTFENYNQDTGVWVFSVEHFTTYGLDDDSDDEDETDVDSQPRGEMEVEVAPQATVEMMDALSESSRQLFRRSGVPGAFDYQEAYEELPQNQSFLGVSSADLAPSDVRLSLEMEDVDTGDEYDVSDDEDMARALSGPHQAAELAEASSEDEQDTRRGTPGGILRARMRAIKDSVGPVRLEVADGDDWAEMLRKTVSPVKRDRQELRELNQSPSKNAGGQQDDNLRASAWGRRSMARTDKNEGLAANAALEKSRGFATSIDLMNSLFEKPKPFRDNRDNMRASRSAKGFPQWPYTRQDKSFDIDEKERAFHSTPRTTWGPNETLVVTQARGTLESNRLLSDDADIMSFQNFDVGTDTNDVRLAKFSSQPSTKYLQAQDKLTDVRVIDGAPFAILRQTSLKDIFHHQEMGDPASLQERRVWDLANILFGQDYLSNLPEHIARKKKLSEFWTELVEQASSTAIGMAATSEDKAVACLAGHRITEACKHLLEGQSFRIGTLVSLIGTSDSARKEMKEQLQSWQDSKMLSEFPEAIRTICEVLSGNVCVCEGLKDVPVEDRMDSFVISKKFGLDWRQAFGMRLWYALNKDEDAKSAVTRFQDDIEQDKEDLPMPWYMEQNVKPIWNDADLGKRQDLLWGLLQLYAEPNTDLEAVLRPENSQLSPVDGRLTWQLGQALLSTGKVSYGKDDAAKADAATAAYAAQLTSGGEWLEAIFVLLHLRDATARKHALQEHLCRHAARIGAENGPNFTTLTEKLLIPASWIWEALALYMRSVQKDASGEVQCLLRAGSYEEAHRVLVNQVAPRAIVERNYAGLSELLSQFEGRQDNISEWSAGGEIYGYFMALMKHRSNKESIPSTLLERLLAGLHAMSESGSDREILRYAAVSDMADETAREILKMAQKKQDMDLRSRILHLPLTQDRLLAYSVDLGLDRYREVVSH